MSYKRFLALLCALVMALSVCAAASAERLRVVKPQSTKGSISWDENYVVKNGETVQIESFSRFWTVFVKAEDGEIDAYDDVVFDCDGPVKGKTSSKWIHITENKRGFTLDLDENQTLKARTGKITVTGKNYKATLSIRQHGAGSITSAVRKKNKVTVKLQKAAGNSQWVYITARRTEEDGTVLNKTIIDETAYGKSSVTFKVQKGWSYSINYGDAIRNRYGSHATSVDYISIPIVTKTTGTETYR